MVQCNKIAEYAKIALDRNGFEVKKAPQRREMSTSIDESNSWGVDLHMPLHTNGFIGQNMARLLWLIRLSVRGLG